MGVEYLIQKDCEINNIYFVQYLICLKIKYYALRSYYMLIYFSDADEDLVMEIFIKVPAIIFGFLCATCIGKGF